MSTTSRKPPGTGADTSRRAFVKTAMLGAGATAALGSTGVGVGAQEAPAEPVTIPPEFQAARAASLPSVDFPMRGAQVFARACHEEGVKALFCCPGNYDVVHAIADTGIPTYGGRHEGSMCHAADAFCRSTGEVAATSGTEGPGFTNMICAIATANAARSPVLVLASNKSVVRRGLGTGHPGCLSAAHHRGSAQVRQAHDYALSGMGVRGVCVPAAQERRSQAGSPRFPGRGGARQVR